MDGFSQLEYLQDILNAFNDLVFVLDEEGIFVDYLASDSTRLIQPKEVFLGKAAKEVLPPYVSHELFIGIDQLQKGLTSCYRFEYPISFPDETRWYSASITRFKSKKDQSQRILAVVRDITEIKEKQDFIEDLCKLSSQGIIWLKAMHG